jgi:hypothetical protein
VILGYTIMLSVITITDAIVIFNITINSTTPKKTSSFVKKAIRHNKLPTMPIIKVISLEMPYPPSIKYISITHIASIINKGPKIESHIKREIIYAIKPSIAMVIPYALS